MSRQGYHNRAVELASQLLKAQIAGSGRIWNCRNLLSEALCSAGRYDQAIAAQIQITEEQAGATKVKALKRIIEIYEESGLQDQADQERQAANAEFNDSNF